MQLPHNVLLEFFITAAGGSRAKETTVVRTPSFTLRLLLRDVSVRFSRYSAYLEMELVRLYIVLMKKNLSRAFSSYKERSFSPVEEIRESSRIR